MKTSLLQVKKKKKNSALVNSNHDNNKLKKKKAMVALASTYLVSANCNKKPRGKKKEKASYTKKQ